MPIIQAGPQRQVPSGNQSVRSHGASVYSDIRNTRHRHLLGNSVTSLLCASAEGQLADQFGLLRMALCFNGLRCPEQGENSVYSVFIELVLFGSRWKPLKILEREMGFEPTASSLGK
jgi:hypothetical protein